jgi:pimeloyl-ACP methyl ester carboxylesterase
MIRYAELSNTTTAYEIVGDGPPLLVMHGAEGDRSAFTAFAAAMSEHASVINYDQRDCGNTKRKGDGSSTLSDIAHDAAELIEYLGHQSVTVLGTSLGGRVAQTLAIQHPDRVGRLVLCNTWPVNADLAELNPAIQDLQRLAAGLPATARDLAIMYFTEAFIEANPQMAERFSRPFPGKAARQMLIAEISASSPSTIGLQTLFVSGEQDRIVPTSVMRDMCAAMPEGRLVTLPGIGHVPSLEAPECLARVVTEWLGNTRP